MGNFADAVTRRLIPAILLVVVGLAIVPRAKADPYLPYHGWCEDGNQKTVTSGLNSTNTVQASYPQCTVTVFLHGGTTKATIYSDSTGTVLANPFTSSTNGQIIWYASPGRYDMQMSGGVASQFPVPVTIEDITLGATSATPTGGIQVNSTATLNSIAPFYGNFGNTPAAPAGNTNCTWQVDALNPTDISCYVPSITGGVQVNGTATLHSVAPYFLNLNGTTPAAPAGNTNVIFQVDSSDPNNVSAYVPTSSISTTPYVQLPVNTYACGSGDTSTVDTQNLCTLNVASLTQGNTAQGPFTNWLSSYALVGPYPAPGSDVGLINTATCHMGDNGGVGVGQSCTTGKVDVPPGSEAMAMICSSGNASCFINVSNMTVTDSNSDTFGNCTGGGGLTALCATVTAGGYVTFTLKDDTPVSATYQDTATVFIMSNFGSVDVDSQSAISSTGAPTTVSQSVTTTSNGDLLISIAGATGNGGSCSAGSDFYPEGGQAFVVHQATNADSGGTYGLTGAYITGAATAGSVTTSMTLIGNCNGGSFWLIAIKPATVGPFSAPPTVRAFSSADYNYLFGIPPGVANALYVGATTYPLCSTVPTTDEVLTFSGGQWCGAAASSTGVTSVGLSLPSFFAVSGSPVTSTGTLAGAYATGLTGDEGYLLGVNASGAAGLNLPGTYSVPVYSGSFTLNDCVKVGATSPVTLADAGSACGSGGGVTSVTGTSPIVVSPTTGATVVSCPTCSTGSGIPAASANLKTAAPVQIPGTSVVYSPDPAVCVAAGSTLTSCSPQRPVVVGHLEVMFYDPDETTSGTCNPAAISSSLGNTINSITATDNLGYLTLYYSKITVAGNDTWTLSGCTNTGSESQFATFVDVPNGGTVESASSAADSCGNAIATPCSTTVTTTQPGDLLLTFAVSSFFNTTPMQFTIWPAGNVFGNWVGDTSYRFQALAAPTAGSYTVKSIASTAHRLATFAITPANPLGTPVFASNATTTVGSIAYGQSVTTSQKIIVQVYGNLTSYTACDATDTLGNVFTNDTANGNSVGVTLIAPVTVAGTDTTITLNSSCNSTGSGAGAGQMAWAIAVPNTYKIGDYISSNAATSSSVLATTDNTIWIPTNFNANEGSLTIGTSPTLKSLGASSTSGASYQTAFGVVPSAQPSLSTTWTGNNTNYQILGSLQLTPTTQPTYTQQPRVTQLADIGAPVTTLAVTAAATTTFNGSLAHGWDVTLGTDITTTDFIGGIDGQSYDFTFCQGTSGVVYTVAAPTNVTVTNWPTILPTGCTSAVATYDAPTATLAFNPAQTLATGCLSPASPAVCDSATDGYVALPAAATSLVVDTTAVAAASGISLTNNDSSQIAGLLGVTANTTPQLPTVSDQTAGTSFTITATAPTTNPNIYHFHIWNPVTDSAVPLPPITNGLVAEWYANVYPTGTPNTIQYDSVGNVHKATAASTGATYAASCINSKACLEYPGTSAGDYTFPTTSPLTNSTIFAIGQNFSTGNYQTIISGLTNSINLYMNYGSPGLLNITQTGTATIGTATSSCAATAGTWYDAVTTYNDSSGAWNIDCDGASVGSGTNALTISAGEQALGFNNSGGGSSQYSNQYQALILVYSRVLSATEVAAVRAWELTLFPSVP